MTKFDSIINDLFIWFSFGFKQPFGIRDLCSWHLKSQILYICPNIFVLGTMSKIARRMSMMLASVRVVVGRGSAVRKSVKVWRRRSVRAVMTLRWRRSALTRRWWTASAPWATRSRMRSTARPRWAAPCLVSPAGGWPGVGRLGENLSQYSSNNEFSIPCWKGQNQ